MFFFFGIFFSISPPKRPVCFVPPACRRMSADQLEVQRALEELAQTADDDAEARYVISGDRYLPRCSHAGCTQRARFGHVDEKPMVMRFCRDHRTPGCWDLRTRMCERCDRRASFNFDNDLPRRTRFCAAHKLDGMVKVFKRSCAKCSTRAVFDWPGAGRGAFCKTHMQPGMVNVMSRTCESCRRRPSFGWATEGRTRRCAAHREEGMANLNVRRGETRARDAAEQ